MPIHYGKINGIDQKDKIKEIEVLNCNYFIYFNELIEKVDSYECVSDTTYNGMVIDKKKFEITNIDEYPNSVQKLT